MTGYAFVLEVKPGYEDEYKKRHDEIWPEMTDLLNEANLKNYHIFRHGLTLFAFFETNDLEASIKILSASEVNKRWGEYMLPIMEIDVDSATGFPFLLPTMFYHK